MFIFLDKQFYWVSDIEHNSKTGYIILGIEGIIKVTAKIFYF